MEGIGLPKRIENLLQIMVKTPSARSHLLLIGPPGSGKTTSAKIFVEAIHCSKTTDISKHQSFFGRALFLNSSDERGLEAVRSRVYPFVRSSFDSLFISPSPKIIIFDEAETLTDQAQIALRPLLDMSPAKVIVIFLCNSISRIHSSIVHKFLVIPFEAPRPDDFQLRMEKIMGKEGSPLMTGMDIQFRRGDIRFFLLNGGKFQDCAKLWHECTNLHVSCLRGLFERILTKWSFLDLAMFCVYVAKTTNTLSTNALKDMLRISDTDLLRQIAPSLRARILSSWFETHVRIKLEQWPPTI